MTLKLEATKKEMANQTVKIQQFELENVHSHNILLCVWYAISQIQKHMYMELLWT